MKSIKDIAWNVTEPEYRANRNVSYSLLSTYDREGQKALLNLGIKKSTEALRFGSLTDVIVTEPEELENRFLISDFVRPTDTLMNILLDIFNNEDVMILDEVDDVTLLKYIRARDYQNNWGDKTVVDKVRAAIKDYFNLLVLAGDRTIMTANDFNTAHHCVEILKTHTWTSKYFQDEYEEGVEGHYQLKFKLDPEDSKIEIPTGVRCMFDRIIVDHNNKTIQPLDLKTTGKYEEEFESSFLMWRYDLQATLYWYILWSTCQKDDYFKDFKVLPFKFVCINRFTKSPLVWTYPDYDKFLRKTDGTGKLYKPWTELLMEVSWFFEYQQYDYSYESYQLDGERELNNYLKVKK